MRLTLPRGSVVPAFAGPSLRLKSTGCWLNWDGGSFDWGLAFFRNGVREHGIFSGQGCDSTKKGVGHEYSIKSLRTIVVHAGRMGYRGVNRISLHCREWPLPRTASPIAEDTRRTGHSGFQLMFLVNKIMLLEKCTK